MSTSWQTVSVFVSSTFNDMHAERDYLIKRVFPELREWCEQRKLRLIDIDLRWGITEADATSNNVVRVCLNRIDDCRPFFLCFLGQRRGWVPAKDEIAPDTCTTFPDLKKFIGSASVTEMEILHAVINPMNKRERADHAFFYFREPSYLDDLPTELTFIRNIYTNDGIPNPMDRMRIDTDLKAWRENVIPKLGQPVHHYTATWNPKETTPDLAIPLQCPSQKIRNQERWKDQWRELGIVPTTLNLTDESPLAHEARKKNVSITTGRLSSFRCGDKDLAAVILHDLKGAISERFPEHMLIREETPLQKELDQQEQFLELNCSGFIMREGDFDALNTYIAGNSRDLYVLTAPGGMGKTMFLANWIRSCQQQNGSDPPILYRFIGVSEGSTTVDAVLRSLLAEMREIGLLQEEIPIDPKELRNKFPDLLTSTGSRGRCIVVIDALNQLESGLRDLHWLPWKLPAGIKMIVSFKREGNEAEDLVSHLHESLSGTFHEIRPFESRDDRKKLVSAYLDQYLKQLDDTFIQELIDSPGAQNPLFLRVVLSELRIYGSFANLGDKIRKDFGTNPVTAFGAVLKRLENDPAFTSIPPETTVPLFFGLISHARVGLSENELIDLYISEVSFEKEAVTDAIRLLLRQMRPFLAIRAGRYDFFYESFRLAAIDRYEGTDTEKNQRLATKWHRSLADYFEQLPAWASQKDNIPTLRRASQLPYHLAWAGKSDHLADLILEYELLETIVFGLGPHAAIDDISYVLSPPVLPENCGIPDKKDGLLLIKDTINLSAHILAQKPNQLPSQLVGRLLKSENPVIRKFNDKLNQFDRYPWLRPVILSLAPPSGPLIFTLDCHTSGVFAVAVTPDCRRAISGHDDNTLRIWDLQTGRELTILREHTDWVTAIAITPDGKRAISGSRDETLKIWDLESGQVITTLTGHTGSVNAVALIPDGHLVISGSDDTTLKVWDLESGRELATFMGHAGSVFALAVTPDGKHAVSGSMDTTLKVWNLKSGNELATLYGHSISVKAVAVTPDGRHAISGSWDTTLKVWDLEYGQELLTFTGHIGFVEAVALSHDGYQAISGSEDNLLKVWDIKSGRELATLTGHSGSIHAVAITPDGRRVVSGSEDNTLKVWELESGRKSADIAGHTRGVTTVAVTPDGHHAISGSWDTTLKVWNLASGQELATLTGHISSVLSVTVSPDGLRVISASEDKTLKVWDMESGRELATLAGHTGSIKTVVVTPDSCRAISGSDDKTLKVWDLKSGRELLTLAGHTHRITAVVVTPDGRRAVSGSWDKTLKVWDLESGRELATLTGHTSIISAIVVTPDGRQAVSGSWDKTLKVWDLESGRELLTFAGHTHWVDTVTLTLDGYRAVSTSFDNTLKVWDLESGRELLTLTGHTDRIKTVAVTLDGRRVISGSKDKTLKVWNLENGTIVTEFYSDGEILTCGYTDVFDSIIVGDEIGRIYILHFETGKLDTW